jgi:hypothetical protein
MAQHLWTWTSYHRYIWLSRTLFRCWKPTIYHPKPDQPYAMSYQLDLLLRWAYHQDREYRWDIVPERSEDLHRNFGEYCQDIIITLFLIYKGTVRTGIHLNFISQIPVQTYLELLLLHWCCPYAFENKIKSVHYLKSIASHSIESLKQHHLSPVT